MSDDDDSSSASSSSSSSSSFAYSSLSFGDYHESHRHWQEITSRLKEFNIWVVGEANGACMKYLKDFDDLKHLEGEDLARELPERYNKIYFEGNANPDSKEYKRVLNLLQCDRRWRSIGLSDTGMTKASPAFLSLLVSALTKTYEVTLSNCPFDQNFFACFNSGMHSLKKVKFISDSAPVSYDAAAMFAQGLAFTTSLKILDIQSSCSFEHGAGLRLMDGIRRNKSLVRLVIDESNLGTTAVVSISRSLFEGTIPNLKSLEVTLKRDTGSKSMLSKLLSSDECHLEELQIRCPCNAANTFETADDTQAGKCNTNLKTLSLVNLRFDGTYLESILPMMPNLLNLDLNCCGISDLSPIMEHLCQPNVVLKSVELLNNKVGMKDAEKFVGKLNQMRTLTYVELNRNPWCSSANNSGEEKAGKRILKTVSKCWNLEDFNSQGCWNNKTMKKTAERYCMRLNLNINRAWRRELCYKEFSQKMPSNLLPVVAARALRRTETERRTSPSLGADVLFPLLKERINDLMDDSKSAA